MKNPAEFYTLKSKKSAQSMGATSNIHILLNRQWLVARLPCLPK